MTLHGRAGVLIAGLFLVAACAAPGSSPTALTPTGTPSVVTTEPAGSTAAGDPNDLLAKIREKGKIVISTDADYAPQSSVKEDGSFEGFDIDVGEEIASRLGVTAEWSPQLWDTVIAGSWSERWDMSVGSITVTPERETIFDFTQPYYFTPAQVAVLTGSGFTSIDDLPGETACVGEDTTYLYWLEGTLNLGEDSELVREAPEGIIPKTVETDANCAEGFRAGQTELGKVFVTSDTVIEQAIKAETPIERLGDPVFYEALSVAFDKNGPPRAELLAEVDRIIGEMHTDGTLSELSEQWYGVDYTITE